MNLIKSWRKLLAKIKLRWFKLSKRLRKKIEISSYCRIKMISLASMEVMYNQLRKVRRTKLIKDLLNNKSKTTISYHHLLINQIRTWTCLTRQPTSNIKKNPRQRRCDLAPPGLLNKKKLKRRWSSPNHLSYQVRKSRWKLWGTKTGRNS